MARACIMFIDRIAAAVRLLPAPLDRCDPVSPHQFADSLRSPVDGEQVIGVKHF